MKWTIRVIAASILCSLFVWALSSMGIFGMMIGSIISAIFLGAMFLWTVAEMIEDGLSDTESVA